MTYLLELPPIASYHAQNNHFDSKTIESTVSLREFIAGTLNYYPAWIKALYAIRWGFVRLLGMKQNGLPDNPQLQPQNVPFDVGHSAGFFKVEQAEEDRYWVVSAKDTHLTAYLVVARESLTADKNRFHIGTIVKYHHWTGWLYFNVIRPFHHVVVMQMIQAGARGTK
jgi:hypothetical protein